MSPDTVLSYCTITMIRARQTFKHMYRTSNLWYYTYTAIRRIMLITAYYTLSRRLIMDFYNVIEERHSVRAYLDAPVEKEKLDSILRAAQLAPTAVNFQPFKVFVISTEGKKEVLKRVYHRDWFSQPPYVMLVCALRDKCWVRRDGRYYGDVDAAIVMDHIILAATAEGLGTCWIGAFDAQAAKEAFGLPDNYDPVAFTPLGYEKKTSFEKKRKDISELVVYL